jgi:protein SHQ1
MPVTPRFTLSQDDDFVVVTAHVPYVRTSGAEVDIDGQTLSVFVPPYLLRLTFPAELVDDDSARAEYDPGKENGTLVVYAPKAKKGEHFPDLDFVTRLLQPAGAGPSGPKGRGGDDDVEDVFPTAPRPETVAAAESAAKARAAARGAHRPLIEVIGGEEEETTSAEGVDAAEAASARSAPLPALLPSASAAAPAYGFHRSFTGFFADLREEVQGGVVTIPEPDAIAPALRPSLRRIAEDAAFDKARYAGDFMDGDEDPIYQEAMDMRPFWMPPKGQRGEEGGEDAGAEGAAAAGGSARKPWEWTEDELAELAGLPNKEYIVDGHIVGGRLQRAGPSAAAASPGAAPASPSPSPSPPSAAAPALPSVEALAATFPETWRLLTGLVTVLFAFAYDHRTTHGETGVESGWTIATLSPLLSWLDDDLVPPQQQAGLMGGSGGVEGVTESLRALLLSPTSDAERGSSTAAAAAAAAAAGGAPGPTPAASSSSAFSSSPHARGPATAGDALRECVRGALCYPYLRRWDLARRCAMDVGMLLRGGTRPVLRALLAVRRTFAKEEARYLLNVLFLNDYAVWVQGVDEASLVAVGEAVRAEARAMRRTDAAFAAWRLDVLEERAENGEPLESEGEEDGGVVEEDDSGVVEEEA